MVWCALSSALCGYWITIPRRQLLEVSKSNDEADDHDTPANLRTTSAHAARRPTPERLVRLRHRQDSPPPRKVNESTSYTCRPPVHVLANQWALHAPLARPRAVTMRCRWKPSTTVTTHPVRRTGGPRYSRPTGSERFTTSVEFTFVLPSLVMSACSALPRVGSRRSSAVSSSYSSVKVEEK